ncbi:hypothetical protein, partial [Gordonibacter urolithinfaciens]|uniref:hypothetical protein n=1 Tax=Gordonibacter urolithinfaciens TaxID=1335613 RepID=UPI003AAA66A8
FISQYPVFKVPASPSGGPRRLPSGRAAQGDTLPSRCHPVKDFFQELSKIFEMPLKRTRDLRTPKSSLQKERPTLSSSAGFV